MAYGILYTAQFKDRFDAITYKVDILQDGYGGGSTAITYMGVNPATLKYKSEKGKDQYIQGSSFTFNFKSLPADNNKYDPLFEGAEKEFKVNYYKDAVLIWSGYLQPDNLSRSYTDELYEIKLNASDWLANLKDVEFRNGSTSYTDNATVLDTVKTCLTFTGLDFPILVQMNTYESTYMTSTTAVLKNVYIDLARFTTTESGKTKYTSVYDVLTYLIKTYNCVLRQVNGQYQIRNNYELASYYFLYDWATLTPGARTSMPLYEDITDFNFLTQSNYTKLKPELRLDFKRNSKDVGGELVADTNDFSGSGPWTISAVDGYTNSNDQINITDNNPTTNNNYIKLDTSSLTATTSLYIKVAFDITFAVGEQWEPISYSVRITKPSSGLSTDENITGTSLYHYESAIKDMFAIDETGVHNIEINISDSSQPYASGVVTIENVRITSVNTGSPEFDQNYIAYIDENAQVKTDEIYFSDTNTTTDQGGFKVQSTGYQKTLAWNRYAKTDGKAIHELFALNLLKNRQDYKDYISLSFIDPDYDVTAASIIQINSKYYKTIEFETIYNKNIHNIQVEEILTSEPTYTFTSQALQSINGEPTSTDDPTGYGTLHANLDGLTADDHLQYYNEARGDARYRQLSVNISHSALDNLAADDHTQYYNQARGDARYLQISSTAYHNDARGDARYYLKSETYTQTEVNNNTYTQSYINANYYTQSQTATNFYTKSLANSTFAALASPNIFTEKQYISLTAGGELLRLIDSGGTTAANSLAYIGFYYGSTPTRVGFMGLAQTATADMFVWAENGQVHLVDSSGHSKITAYTTGGLGFKISTGSEYWLMANNGDFHAEGDVIAFSTTVSDKELKHKIEPLDRPLDKILKIDGCSFEYKMNKSGRHVGIIAQDLKKIIPEVVIKKKLSLKTNSNKKYYVIRYTELIPYVIEAIKELSLKVSVLINNFSRLVKKIDKTKAIADENDNEIKRLKHEINLLKKEVYK